MGKAKKDRFTPREIFIKDQPYWQVNLPSQGGRRMRRTFKHYGEAKRTADLARIQNKNSGSNGFSISDRLRTEAIQAEETLRPFGVSITDAVKFYASYLTRVTESESVAHVVKEILVAKGHDNLRPRYLLDLKSRLTRFSEAYADRKIASLSAGEIDSWLRSLPVKPQTRNTIRLRLGVLFSYALQRGWCPENPIAKVRKVRVNASTIGILTPEEFAKVLGAASEETLPYWLLGGFAGLRRAEIERLEWKDVHFTEKLIEVPALKAKTASRRFVRIQDNLAAWIKPYVDRTGKVCPPNLRKLLETDRTNAGLKMWPPNALRHSFASYALAHSQNAAELALELGHSTQELIFRNYRELVKPAEAAKYWGIRPAPQSNLVAISA